MLIRQALSYLPAQVIGPVCQFLAVVALTHYLPPGDLGNYNLAVSIQELLYYSIFSWLGFYVLRSYARHEAEGDGRRFAETERTLLLVLMGLEAAIGTAALLLFVDRGASAAFLMAFVLYAVSRACLIYLGERARAAHEVANYTIAQLAPPLLGLVLTLVLLETREASAVLPLAGFAIAQTIGLAAVAARTGVLATGLGLDRAILRQALGYGLPLVGLGLVTWVSMHAGRFIVDHFLGRSEVAQFAVAQGLADRILTFVALLLSPAVFPLAVKAMEAEGPAAAMARLREGCALGLMLLVPAVAGLAALAHPIAHLLLGSEYEANAARLLPLAALAAGLSVWTAPSQAFMLHHRSDLSFRFSLLDAGVMLAASFVLVPWLGIEGAILARIVASLVAISIASAAAWRWYRSPFPATELVLSGLAAAIMAGVLLFFEMPVSIAGLGLEVLLGAAVYVGLIALFFRNTLAVHWREMKQLLSGPRSEEAGP